MLWYFTWILVVSHFAHQMDPFFWVHLVPKKALSDRGDGEDVSNPVVYVKTAKEAAMAAQAWKLTAAAEATRLPPRPFLEGVFYMRDSSGVVDPCGSPKFWLVKPPWYWWFADGEELQEELDGMCEVTARVAVALKSSVEETAQTREAVALLNDQAGAGFMACSTADEDDSRY